MPIVELVPPDFHPSADHARALLELAYLVTAVDGSLADVELDAFGALAARLRGEPLTSADLDALIGDFAGNVDASEIEARVREVAGALPAELYELAYKLALAFAFVDLDPSPAEDRLHGVLAEALGISPERREALSREVSLSGSRFPAASSS